jgi:hypothetical protein
VDGMAYPRDVSLPVQLVKLVRTLQQHKMGRYAARQSVTTSLISTLLGHGNAGPLRVLMGTG